MRSRLISRSILSCTLLSAVSAPFAQAAVQDRIATVSGSNRTTLQGTVSGRAKHSTDLGLAPADRKMDSLSLRFSLTSSQQADLNQLFAAQLNPSSASYRQWLTPEQYGARFGLSSSDLAKVSNWLTSQGFTITSTARSATFITFSGTVAQVQQAFGTSIHSLSLNGEQHISNMTDPVLPAAIAGVVSDVTGLNDFQMKPRSRVRSVSIDPSQPLYTQTINGTTNHFISPSDFYTIYDVNSLTTASTPITGAGITIAVMGQTDIVPADVAAFRSAAGLPASTITQRLVGLTDPGISSGDVDEAHLDVEWSGAVAQGATILYVYSSANVGGVFNALTYAIDNAVAPIVTISYGECESGWGTASLASINLMLQEANIKGITVIGPAGDSGATDCELGGLAKEGLNVDFPGSSPYVVSAGGSMFSADAGSPANYWNNTNASNGSSVIQYIPEVPWNETTATAGLGDGVTTGGGAGGGGASAFFSKPAWQVGTGVPADSARDVPDISLNAAANHDGYLVCTSGSSTTDLPCINGGFLTSSGQPNVFGGTSFVAPSFAGILALVEQKLGNTTGLGNVGPTLYGLTNMANVFHDITSGNNSVQCIQGTLNCPSGGAIGYNATVGYDQASGLGTIDITNLVNGWKSAVPSGTGSTVGAGITTTSVTTSAALCGVSSGSLALSVTVTGSIAGTIPTGTVQFFVDNVAVTGGSVPLPSGSSTATYTLVTSGLSSGGHTIGAVYSGDGNYAGSKGTLLGPANLSAVIVSGNTASTLYPNGSLASVDIVSSHSADFSICTSAPTASVQPGATSSGITFTVTPFNGFTGSVNLTATNNDSMVVTPTFTIIPVSITTSTGVTTSFVVKASQTTTSTARLLPAGQQPSGKTPWYAAGSGATLACILMLTLPRRRRWGALLAAVLSVAAFTAVGCSNSSTTGGSSGGTTPVNTTTNASPGTYTFTITGVSGSLVHSSQVAITVP